MSRPSDQWLKSETAVLEAAEVTIGLVTVANTVDMTSDSGVTVYSGAGEAYIGLATVDVGNQSYSYKHFANANTSLATTFSVKASAGFLHSVTAGSTSNPTIGLFDHASAATNPVYIITPGTAPLNYIFDESMSNGLTVEVSEGETTNLNISYS